jgi:methionyl-tRNA formyltransferase
MRVVALCETVAHAARLWRRIEPLPGIELSLLVANNSGQRRARFYGARTAELVLRPRAALRMARHIHLTACRLDDPAVGAWLDARQADVGLHGSSLIYRAPLIARFRLGILNAHIGLLPKYRGRAVMEWSLLNGDPTGITTFFVDEGIDTGPRVVLREEVSVARCGSAGEAKAYLFSLDAEMFARALEMMRDGADGVLGTQPAEGTRWYVMSELFTSVVDELLAQASERPATQ